MSCLQLFHQLSSVFINCFINFHQFSSILSSVFIIFHQLLHQFSQFFIHRAIGDHQLLHQLSSVFINCVIRLLIRTLQAPSCFHSSGFRFFIRSNSVHQVFVSLPSVSSVFIIRHPVFIRLSVRFIMGHCQASQGFHHLFIRFFGQFQQRSSGFHQLFKRFQQVSSVFISFHQVCNIFASIHQVVQQVAHQDSAGVIMFSSIFLRVFHQEQ